LVEVEHEQAHAGEQPLGGADLLRGCVRGLVARAHELDPQVRADADDSVHDLRVTVRRLRSNLASYAPALVADETAPIRSELQWLGEQLGDEVSTQRARMDVDHRAARARLLSSMEEPRYAALLARLDALGALTQAAQASAEELVRSGAHEDWRPGAR
jgi:CHAD domain-containing protein